MRTFFFEQMLVALEMSLHQQHALNVQTYSDRAESQSHVSAPFTSLPLQQIEHRQPRVDEDCQSPLAGGGAFSTLFGVSEAPCVSSDDEPSNVVELSHSRPGVPKATGDLDDPCDADKSVMVCRHWKSKGWCRMEMGCKFRHPESKRGTTAHKLAASAPKPSSGNAGGEGAASPGTDASAPEGGTPTTSAAGRRKRKSKAKSGAQQEGNIAGDVTKDAAAFRPEPQT